jgi:hypothetical protein
LSGSALESEETTMQQDGLERMLNFLNFLRQKKIHFFLEQDSDRSLMVTMTLVGVRVEVAFTVEDMTFSVFKGREDVIVDKDVLFSVIKENWD